MASQTHNNVSANVNLHARTTITEDNVLHRDMLSESLVVHQARPGGQKYIVSQDPQTRWEKYDHNIWKRLGLNHPQTNSFVQGNRSGEYTLVDGLTHIGRIPVAINALRFVQANKLTEVGEDKLAATYIDEFSGATRYADTTRQQVSASWKYDESTGLPVKDGGTSVKTLATDKERVNYKYGAARKYSSIANGGPTEKIYPLLDDELTRAVACVTANVALADGDIEGAGFPNYGGDKGVTGWLSLNPESAEKYKSFMGTQSGFFSSITSRALGTEVYKYRAIPSGSQIIGLSMVPIPVNGGFESILNEKQDFVSSPGRYVDGCVIPTAIIGIPYITGKFTKTNDALIAAGDVLPGGIVYRHLMCDRIYTYLALGHEEASAKTPELNTNCHVGSRGEVAVGSENYIPVELSGDKDYFTVSGTVIAPADGVPLFTFGDNYKVADYTAIKLLVSNVESGASEVVTATYSAAGFTATSAITATGGSDWTVAIISDHRIDVGFMESFEVAEQAIESAMGDTAINRIQGLDNVARTYLEYVYNVYCEVGRKVTISLNSDGDTMAIDFAAETAVLNKSGIETSRDYGLNEFMSDAIARGLIGIGVARIDVFDAMKVSRI